jgi:3',5'-nucleoside bisphosphate phosphatase
MLSNTTDQLPASEQAIDGAPRHLEHSTFNLQPTLTLRPNDGVDLHMHSPASDGQWTPKTLPPAAAELGIKVLALTDHDEILGIAAMAESCRAYGIHLIPAVELSTYFAGVGYHMLAYNLDLGNARLQSKLAEGRRYYEEMVLNAVDQLRRQGKEMDPEKSAALTNRPLKLYHLVSALIENGHAKNGYEAYGIANSAGAHFGWSQPMEEAIALVHEAGGLAVIAHPGRAEPGFTAATADALDGMRAAGLDGVEVFHSYHTPVDIAFYLTYAEKHDMLIGCGSDTHGPGQSKRMLTPWPAATCRRLLEACGVAVSVAEAR